MIHFVWNLCLAVIWAATTSSFSPWNLLVGFVLSYLLLASGESVIGGRRYLDKVPAAGRFVAYFLGSLIRANLLLAYDTVTPSHRLRAAVIGIPLEARTDLEITLLANLISFTPGTLSLDLSDDRRTLYIHAMFLGTIEDVRGEVRDGLEAKLLRLLR